MTLVVLLLAAGRLPQRRNFRQSRRARIPIGCRSLRLQNMRASKQEYVPANELSRLWRRRSRFGVFIVNFARTFWHDFFRTARTDRTITIFRLVLVFAGLVPAVVTVKVEELWSLWLLFGLEVVRKILVQVDGLLSGLLILP